MHPFKIITLVAVLAAGCSPDRPPPPPVADDPGAPTAATAPLPEAPPTLTLPTEGGGDGH